MEDGMINLKKLSIERPLGSSNNDKILELIKNEFRDSSYELISLPTICSRWDKKRSFIEQDNIKIDIFPSPFSKKFVGIGKIIICSELSNLKNSSIKNNILVLQGSITKTPIMPKNFPFYFPDENKAFYEALEKANPSCILSLTGKSPISGLDPYPFFEDGNFLIPSAYCSEKTILNALNLNKEVKVTINSETIEKKTEQIVLRKNGELDETIVICAHMDSKYETVGALDNASGLYTLIKIASKLKKIRTSANIEIVPFNGEEYFGVVGQLKFLDYSKNKKIKLVVNIDSPGYKGSKNALSFYNFKAKSINTITKKYNIEKGTEWFAGDHAMFAFQGIPCITATSNNLFEKAINITHTDKDTLANIDKKLLNYLADDLSNIILDLDKNEIHP